MSKKIKIGIKKSSNKFKLIGFEEDIPDSLIGSMPVIVLTGNTKCTLEGNCSIIEYEEGMVKISFKNGFLTFLGENFNISVFDNNRIAFDGKILSIEFSC